MAKNTQGITTSRDPPTAGTPRRHPNMHSPRPPTNARDRCRRIFSLQCPSRREYPGSFDPGSPGGYVHTFGRQMRSRHQGRGHVLFRQDQAGSGHRNGVAGAGGISQLLEERFGDHREGRPRRKEPPEGQISQGQDGRALYDRPGREQDDQGVRTRRHAPGPAVRPCGSGAQGDRVQAFPSR